MVIRTSSVRTCICMRLDALRARQYTLVSCAPVGVVAAAARAGDVSEDGTDGDVFHSARTAPAGSTRLWARSRLGNLDLADVVNRADLARQHPRLPSFSVTLQQQP